MNLLPDFPNTTQIVSTLFVLIVVNAVLTAAIVWVALDLNAYRRYHRESMEKLRSDLKAVRDLFGPTIKGTSRNIDPGFLKDVYPETGVKAEGAGGFRWTAPVVTHASGRADPMWSGYDSFAPPIILGTEPPEWKEGAKAWWGNVPAIIISDPEKSEPNIIQIALDSSTGPGVTTEVVRRESLTKRRGHNQIDDKLPGLYPTSMEDGGG